MEKVIVLTKSKQNSLHEYMPKQSTLNRLAGFFSVFSDATRIKILTALAISEMCVNDLSILLNINQTTVSHQLRFLRQNDVVATRRDGKLVYYSLSHSAISEVMLNGVNYLLNE